MALFMAEFKQLLPFSIWSWNKTVEKIWIPGGVGISGNEIANQWAKDAENQRASWMFKCIKKNQ